MSALFNTLKERRFTTTARILGEVKAKGCKVQIINQPNGVAAWWDSAHKTIVLNSAIPVAKDSKTELVYERAKLYHELFHVLFTTNEKLRKELALKSNNQARYLWVSNALEDGRIEYHGGKVYDGTTWYIRTILEHLVTSDSPDSGLLIYVRTKLWRNANEAKFWSKYQAQIDAAIVAKDSSVVWQIAYDMVQDMMPPQPPTPPPTEPQEPTEDDGEGEGSGGENETRAPKEIPENDEDEAGDEDGDSDADTEDEDEDADSDEGDKDGDSDDEDGDGDAEDDAEDDDSEDESEDAGDDSGTPTQPPTSSEVDGEIMDELQDIIDQAMDAIGDEVEQELIEIQAEMATYVQEQEYATAAEEITSGNLAEIFASMLVESDRQKWEPCKRGGSLDDRRLVETRTGGVFMHERIEKASQPHIVLLIDLSYSMSGMMRSVSRAARMLNGAIQASGATSKVMTFGEFESEQVGQYNVVPREDFIHGWSTPTAAGLKAAHNWLLDENVKRGMVIVITDGEPNNPVAAAARFEDLKNDGFYVMDVLLDGLTVTDRIRAMCHDWVSVEDCNDLVKALEAPLDNFLSGSF